MELARRLDTHPSNVRRWEISRVSPRWETVVRIAEALEVPVEDLAAGQDSRASEPLASEMRSVDLSTARYVPSSLLAQRRRQESTQEDEARVEMLHEQTSRLADTHEQRAAEYRALSRLLRS